MFKAFVRIITRSESKVQVRRLLFGDLNSIKRKINKALERKDKKELKVRN